MVSSVLPEKPQGIALETASVRRAGPAYLIYVWPRGKILGKDILDRLGNQLVSRIISVRVEKKHLWS